MNAPTILDVILACIFALPLILFLLWGILPFNKNFDPKGNDPYRYCPKEEEEW